MTPGRIIAVFGLLAVLGACGEDSQIAAAPPALEPTREAIGHYCGMLVVDHAGPKGQIFLQGESEPLWFSSVRDTLAFTMLPEEPKTIAAVYVNDMAKARDWDRPEPGTWIEAHGALFVVGSDARGGMGALELVPFSDRVAAERFRDEHGGSILAFDEVPEHAVLGPDAVQDAAGPGSGGSHDEGRDGAHHEETGDGHD